ncbi:MAG: SHOCT domain-containing protein [candidate division KSB1 bacterium]|nr:SHOCT domain-containing protein [candidate division KSB1 bacterium]
MEILNVQQFFAGWAWLVALILLVLLLLVIIKLYRIQKHPEGNLQEKALEILEERYEKGEITKKEYQEQKKEILS